MGTLSKNFDVKEFVPKEVYAQYGDKAKQFISDNVVKIAEALKSCFKDYYTRIDSDCVDVFIFINGDMFGLSMNWRGLRTVSYINEQVKKGIHTAMLSQHIGGSCNAIDFNVVKKMKSGGHVIVKSDDVFNLILNNESYFLSQGLTTLENKTMTQGWTHADCRFTGLDKIYIVNP